MTRMIIAGSIVVMLMFFTSLGALNSSKSNKQQSNSEQEQTEETVKSKPAQSEEKKSEPASSKSSHADKEQPVQAIKSQAVHNVKEKSPESVSSKSVQSGREKPVLSATSNNSLSDKAQATQVNVDTPQTYKEKPVESYISKPIRSGTITPAQLSSNPLQPGNMQTGQFGYGIPLQPAYRDVAPAENEHQSDNENEHNGHHGGNGYHDGNGNHDNHGGYGHHNNFNNCDNHYYYGFGPSYHHCYGWFPYTGCCHPGLNIYFTWHNEIIEFQGFLADNNWDSIEYDYSGIHANYRPFPFENIHWSTDECPDEGYGIIVKKSDGEYAFFHLDEDGNQLAEELLLKRRNHEAKIFVEVKGILNMENHTITVLSLKKATGSTKYTLLD